MSIWWWRNRQCFGSENEKNVTSVHTNTHTPILIHLMTPAPNIISHLLLMPWLDSLVYSLICFHLFEDWLYMLFLICQQYSSTGSDIRLAPARRKPLSETILVNLLTHICVTRPQWVKWTDWPNEKGWQGIKDIVTLTGRYEYLFLLVAILLAY